MSSSRREARTPKATAAEVAVVTLEHIEKRYCEGAAVLSDVSLTLEPGGFYFLTGASGAGKTTLLKIIYLAELPSRGRLNLFGADTVGLDRNGRAALRRRMGIVFQDLRLLDELSAHDNVALPLRVTGAPEGRVSADVAELMAWLGLADCINAPTATLSGGERQRLAIARALIRRPELLIADEPTGKIDDEAAVQAIAAFEQINRQGSTVLIATHDMAIASHFGHQRFHLDHGVLSMADNAPSR